MVRPAAQPGSSSSQPLPGKELGLFRKIIKSYEQKQYKVGLRCAKTILSNPQFAEHGETLAMRGLILHCINRQTEAMDCVKRGLRSDIRSYVCWHVYGIVHRGEKKYDEAIKAYKQALRLDAENMQILRDLAVLQVQLRDYEGYRESRYELLRLRPNQRASWVAFATACHLVGEHDKAIRVLNEHVATHQPSSNALDVEFSEILLYRVKILNEAGRHADALQSLEENATHIYDKLTYWEMRADLLQKLGDRPAAVRLYEQLVKRNPDCVDHYKKLMRCQGVDDSDAPAQFTFWEARAREVPNAAVPKLQALLVAEGEELRKRLRTYLIGGIRKGIPSIWKTLAPLYAAPAKRAILDETLVDLLDRLERDGYAQASFEDNGEVESPSTAVWLYAVVAQHQDKMRRFEAALEMIDRALRHTPTLNDLLVYRAKIYKHAGDPLSAAQWMEEAQALDTADRFMNSKCAKYLLRAGLVDQAEAMCSKFTREGLKAAVSLHEMQCIWWEIENARARQSRGEYGEALKHVHAVEKHFQQWVDDQFDFHTYCVRKQTMCSYVDMLRLEDRLRQHPFYSKAARIAMEIYLLMIDSPEVVHPGAAEAARLQGLDESERRKLKRKENKKKAQQAAAEAAAAVAAAEAAKKAAAAIKKAAEEDGEAAAAALQEKGPTADELLRCQNPLDEAAKFAAPLVQFDCGDAHTYLLAFEVYRRRDRGLLQLKCLSRARDLVQSQSFADVTDLKNELHVAELRFLAWCGTPTGRAALETPGTGPVFRELSSRLFGASAIETGPSAYHESWLATADMNNIGNRMTVVEATAILQPSQLDDKRAWLLRGVESAGTSSAGSGNSTAENPVASATATTSLDTLRTLLERLKAERYGKATKEEIELVIRRGRQFFKEAACFGGGAAGRTTGTTETSTTAQHQGQPPDGTTAETKKKGEVNGLPSND